jgi:transposase InsO family protein
MIRALLLVAREIALAHDRWLATVARRRPLAAENAALRETVERQRAQVELLRARLLCLHPRRRPRYRAWERLAILWHRARYGLSVSATARAFVLSVQTVVNWKREVESGGVRIVQAKPPVNKLPDLVLEIAHRLKGEWPRWSTRRIAGILARLGLKASRSTVQRALRERPPRPAAGARVLPRRAAELLAKRPDHIWLVDFTRVGGIFRSVFVGAVVDAFSRKVLALRVCVAEPTAAFAVRLLREAVVRPGPSDWVVTDHGRQFTSAAFTRALTRRGIRLRFGAVARTGSRSLARVDRFWRSMKTEYARGLFLYRSIRTIERDLTSFVSWFNAERPHVGLALRTPDDVHLGRRRRQPRALTRGVLAVRFLGGDHRLPVLRLRDAA